ncbi:MAG: SDR family oxidoreductase [Flavobacteriales bacterium]|nr:SDR family oxidoreductase [Flavobacteriales bacterium]
MLKNKVALVTGAGSGIGEAIAMAFAAQGAKLVLTDVDQKGGERVMKQVKKLKTDAIFVKADVSVPADCERQVKEAVKAFGRLDIAVNNAGIGGPAAKIGDYPIDGWDKVIGVNLSGVFYGMRYQIPAMLKNKKDGGSIVNIASILAQVGFAMNCAYVAAKHGIVGLTQNAALEYGPNNVRVNAVGPGFIRTPLLDKNLDKQQIKDLVSLHPIGRLGTPEEVAELVLWLASEKASFVTGSYYNIDGGYLAK